MTRWLHLSLFAALTSLTLASAQSLVSNGGFEEGLSGWEAVNREGGTAALSADKPAQGKSCLLLQTTGKAAALVLSPALAGPGVGELAVVTFSARRGAGQSNLSLDVVGAASECGEAVVWEALLPAGTDWHKVALLLRVPPVPGGAAPRLAFAASGAAGSWAIDEVSVSKGSLPTVSTQPMPGGPAVTPHLPDGWQPEGILDAKSLPVGSEQELGVTVNGVTLTARPTMACYRGFREGMVIYAANRGKVDKEVQVTVETPVGVEAPSWTVPIAGDGTTRFHIGVQCLRQGEFNVRVTFASAGDQAALPVKVTSKRCYPALGVLWDGQVTPEEARPLCQAPLDMQLLVGPPDYGALGPMAEAFAGLGADILGAPRAGGLTDLQYGAALGQLGAQMAPSFWVPYVAPGDDPVPAATAAVAFAAQQRKNVRPAGVFSPPLDLRRTWPDGKLVPSRPELLSADKTVGLMAMTVRPPQLGAPCVLGEQVDGKSDGVSGAMASLNRQADLTSVRGILAERQVNLPMLVTSLRARSSGDERLDALYLARALTLALYQGSTGAVLLPHRAADNGFGVLPLADADGKPSPVARVISELSQELMSATPVVGLAATEGVAADPRAPISFFPFLRGGEGLLVIWNNTGTSRDVSIEFRSQPVVGQYVKLAYQGEFAQRTWDPIFKFGEDAFTRKRPLLIMRINPLELDLMSFRLLDPHPAWLRAIEFAKPYSAPQMAMPPGREERTWWRDMLKAQPQAEPVKKP